jgi:hypothetical protein
VSWYVRKSLGVYVLFTYQRRVFPQPAIRIVSFEESEEDQDSRLNARMP